MRKFITITGNSGSGKTSLGKMLELRGWHTLYNYTTREPRGDEELDDYIFLTDKQFDIKKANGDFIEDVEYNGNRYALSSNLKDGNTYVIVNPDGRKQLKEMFVNGELWVDEFHSIFLTLDKELQRARLIKRGSTEEEINKRIDDDFQPTSECSLYNGATDTFELADIIVNEYS